MYLSHGECAPCWVLASLSSGIHSITDTRHRCPPVTITFSSAKTSSPIPVLNYIPLHALPLVYPTLFSAICRHIPFNIFPLSSYKSQLLISFQETLALLTTCISVSWRQSFCAIAAVLSQLQSRNLTYAMPWKKRQFNMYTHHFYFPCAPSLTLPFLVLSLLSHSRLCWLVLFAVLLGLLLPS